MMLVLFGVLQKVMIVKAPPFWWPDFTDRWFESVLAKFEEVVVPRREWGEVISLKLAWVSADVNTFVGDKDANFDDKTLFGESIKEGVLWHLWRFTIKVSHSEEPKGWNNSAWQIASEVS